MKQLVLFIAIACSLPALANPPRVVSVPVIITVEINANGNSKVDGHKADLDSLSAVLGRKMWDKYLATKKMQDKIKIVFKGQVLMGVRGSSLDAIGQAQEETLKKLCQAKFGKDFDQLTAAQQSSLKSKFKILFQKLAW